MPDKIFERIGLIRPAAFCSYPQQNRRFIIGKRFGDIQRFFGMSYPGASEFLALVDRSGLSRFMPRENACETPKSEVHS